LGGGGGRGLGVGGGREGLEGDGAFWGEDGPIDLRTLADEAERASVTQVDRRPRGDGEVAAWCAVDGARKRSLRLEVLVGIVAGSDGHGAEGPPVEPPGGQDVLVPERSVYLALRPETGRELRADVGDRYVPRVAELQGGPRRLLAPHLGGIGRAGGDLPLLRPDDGGGQHLAVEDPSRAGGRGIGSARFRS